MQIQRDRIRIIDAEYQNLVQSQGVNSAAAQRATVRLERERLALANLDRELRNLNDSLNDSSSRQSTGILDELNDALPEMPTKLQAVGMAFGVVTAGLGAATTAVKELMTDFKELQKQSYELNMPVPDTEQFLCEMKLASGDIGDIEGYIRGISDAWVKGEFDDPEFIALRKYGAEITDATGRLKNFKDLTDEVYKAWKKADAAGEKFFQMLLDDTEFIVERTNEIQTFGRVTVGVFEELAPKINSLFPSGQFSTLLKDSKKIYDEMTKNQESFKPNDEMKKYLDAQSAANPINALMNAFSESDVVKRATQEQKIYNGEIEETNTVIGKVEKGLKALTESQEEYGDVLSQYGSQRVKQFKDELVNFQLEIDFKDDDYGKAIAELELWRKRELEDKNFVTQGERDAI